MKKLISLKTTWKSLNNAKGKEEGDFVVLQKPVLNPDILKEDPYCSGRYTSVLTTCDPGGGEEEKGSKNRSKGEGLMGTLRRRLSAKQKTKGKSSAPSMGSGDCGDREDAFSSISVPVSFSDDKVQRALRSSSLRSHHYSPTPWPMRQVNSEVKVKAVVHSPSSSLSDECKEFCGVSMENLFADQGGALRNLGPQSRALHLNISEDMPVVIGLTPQDYIQYTMPLDERMYSEGSHTCCSDGSVPMELGELEEFHQTVQVESEDADPELDLPQELLAQSLNGLLGSSAGMLFQNAGVHIPTSSHLLPSFASSDFPNILSGFAGAHLTVAERVRHHLNFDPSSAPGVCRVYDSVQSSGPIVMMNLTEELKKLAKQGWYWGPITRWEAEEKLTCLPDGSFIVRDSSDDRYLLSLSFRSQGRTLHTRIEHSNGRFSFYEQPDLEGHISVVDLIELSIKDSENGAFCYSRSRVPGSATYPVRLTNPVSRFMQVRSLQYLCRFVIRQYTRIDLIQKLPLPNKMKDYLQEKHY